MKNIPIQTIAYTLAAVGAVVRELRIPARAYAASSLATLDLHKVSEHRVLTFRGEWRGDYEIGVIVPSRVPNPLPDAWQASNAHIKFSWPDGAGELDVNDAFRIPWWAQAKSGFSLAVFNVPDDVPHNTDITVELTLEQVCEHVARHFHNADVYFRKRSDK